MLANMLVVYELIRSLLANKRQIMCCDWLAIINIAAEWTDDAIVEFISVHEKNPCLYDTSSNEYWNKNLKRTVEADIGEKLQETGHFTNYG